MICVELVTETLVAAVPPSVTVAPDKKFEPVIVTERAPVVRPVAGEIDVTVGELTKVKPLASVAL